MENDTNLWNKFRNNEVLARVFFLILPWFILGLIGKVYSVNQINIKFSDPVDWTLFFGLMMAICILLTVSTGIGDFFIDKESKESSLKIRAYTYEDIASLFSTVAGGLIFLMVSGRSNLPTYFALSISAMFYIMVWFLLTTAKRIRQNM